MVKTRAMKAEEDRLRDAYLIQMTSSLELQQLRNGFLPTARIAKIKVGTVKRPLTAAREKITAFKVKRIYELYHNLGWTYEQIG